MADETVPSPEVHDAMIELAPISDGAKDRARLSDFAAAGFEHPAPAADRLRTFEDEHLGKDAVRIGGRIERGSGSPFAALDDEHKRQYAALERLIESEQKLASAHAALIAADAEHDAALAAAEPKPDAAE